MICLVCGCKLANDLKGKEAHMKRYHALTIEKPIYKPMDPKQKAEAIRRMEARLNGNIVLDDNGQLTGYGVIEPKKQEEELYPELPTTDFGFEEQRFKETIEATDKTLEVLKEVIVTPEVDNDGWPVLEQGPINSQEDVLKRLDNLVVFSDAVLAKMKQVFGE